MGASTERLLIAAELMELKKPYEDGSLREVALDDLHNFKNSGELFGLAHDSKQEQSCTHPKVSYYLFTAMYTCTGIILFGIKSYSGCITFPPWHIRLIEHCPDFTPKN